MKKDSGWIDVHDDDVMRAMGFFRPYNQTPRDESVWTKTPEERKRLKKYKRRQEDMHFHSVPEKFIKVPGKLIIQLVKNKKYPNTTYSHKCWQSDVPFILAKYADIVRKYIWNGKTYSPNQLPV